MKYENANQIGEPRVLVVDDEPFVLTVLERFLKDSSFVVGTAGNGVEALKLFAEGHWDLVITDRAMPEMNGEELARHIRKEAPGAPIILMTGFAHPGTAAKLFDTILSKPFTKEEFLQSVNRVLQSRIGCEPAWSVCSGAQRPLPFG